MRLVKAAKASPYAKFHHLSSLLPDWKECSARRIYPPRKALCYCLQSAQFSAKFEIIRAEFHVKQL